jgi:hypothetical protein
MMTGPQPVGRPWTRDDDRRLLDYSSAGMDAASIAQKLKRTAKAVRTWMGPAAARRMRAGT